MKTHVLILSQAFPKGHADADKPTRFGASVVQTVKIHTICENYEEWYKKINEVLAGEAVLSVRVWEDKPYRSKQMEILRLDKDSGVGVQKLRSFDEECAYFISEKGNVLPVDLQELANNDGLSLSQWKEWFKVNTHFPLAIIHFTDFRYCLHSNERLESKS